MSQDACCQTPPSSNLCDHLLVSKGVPAGRGENCCSQGSMSNLTDSIDSYVTYVVTNTNNYLGAEGCEDGVTNSAVLHHDGSLEALHGDSPLVGVGVNDDVCEYQLPASDNTPPALGSSSNGCVRQVAQV